MNLWCYLLSIHYFLGAGTLFAHTMSPKVNLNQELRKLNGKVLVLGGSIIINDRPYREGDVFELEIKEVKRAYRFKLLKITKKHVELIEESTKKVILWNHFSQPLTLNRYAPPPENLTSTQELKLKKELHKILYKNVNIIGAQFFLGKNIYRKGDFISVKLDDEIYRLKVASVSQLELTFLNESSKKIIKINLNPPREKLVFPMPTDVE